MEWGIGHNVPPLKPLLTPNQHQSNGKVIGKIKTSGIGDDARWEHMSPLVVPTTHCTRCQSIVLTNLTTSYLAYHSLDVNCYHVTG